MNHPDPFKFNGKVHWSKKGLGLNYFVDYLQIENLEDLINEKDEQLKAHLTCTSTESTDSAISSMEESIFEKDKQIER